MSGVFKIRCVSRFCGVLLMLSALELIGLRCEARKTRVDSLRRVLAQQTEPDKDRMIALSDLAISLSKSNPEEAVSLAREAMGLSRKLNNLSYRPDLYYILGDSYLKLQQQDSAFRNLHRALYWSKKLRNSSRAISVTDRLAVYHYSRQQFDSSLHYFDSSRQYARVEEKLESEALAVNNMGAVSYYLQRFDTARHCFQLALELHRELDDSAGMARAYNNIGRIQIDQGQYQQAMETYQQALKIFEARNNSLGQAHCKGNLGQIFSKLGQPEQALAYYLEAESLFTAMEEWNEVATARNSIANAYSNLGKNRLALKYQLQNLAWHRETNDTMGLQLNLVNIASNFNRSDQPDRALEYLAELTEINELKGQQNNRYYEYIQYASAYSQKKQFQKVQTYNFKALEAAEALGQQPLIMEASREIAELAAMFGHFRTAYEHIYQYSVIRDTLLTADKNKAIQEMEAKYQNEKKTLELARKDAEIEAQEQRSRFLIGVGALLTLLLVLVGYGYVDKRRTNRLLARQKQQIEESYAELNNAYEEIKTQKETIEQQHDQLTEAYEEIQMRNEELAQSIDTIQAQQKQLIESEKTALLGRVSAGVAHELNTPLGAIHSSADSVRRRLIEKLPALPEQLSTLPADARAAFTALLLQSLEVPRGSFSTREERALVREMASELEGAFGEEANAVARALVRAMFREVPAAVREIEQPRAALTAMHHVVELRQTITLMDNIQSSVEKTGKIVQALRQLTQHHGQTGTHLLPVADTVEEVLRRYQNYFRKGIEVETHLLPDVRVEAREEDLWQVWTQIVFNAIQAMSEQGHLRIDMEAHEAEVVVRFRDTGPGVPPEIQDRIFEPMFTTKGEGEGTGIGLFVCQSIVQRYGGNIRMESAPGQTVFSVHLPRQSPG